MWSTSPTSLVTTARDAESAAAAKERGRRRGSIELSVIVVLLAVATATRFVDAVSPRFLPALQALGASIIPLALGVLLLAVLTKRWRIGLAAGLLAATQLAGFAGWWIAGEHAVPDGDDAIVVMAANLQYGRADDDVLMSEVRDHDVDVLVLTEITASAAQRLEAAGIDDLLPHAIARTREDAGGTAIFSRHDLEAGDRPAPSPLLFEAVTATTRTPAGPINLLAAHPVPPWPGDTRRWHAELGAVAEWAHTKREDAVPLGVAGDLNATDAHPVLRRLEAAGLYDAHDEIGGGVVATWPRTGQGEVPLTPLLHLDHIFVRGLGVSAAGTSALAGTDHDAVWARLRPNE